MSQPYAPPVAVDRPPATEAEPRQYSPRGILGVWAAAALPMAVLARLRHSGG